MVLDSMLWKVAVPKTEFWLKWRCIISLEEHNSINAGEEQVLFNFECSSFSSQTMTRLAFEEPHYNIISLAVGGSTSEIWIGLQPRILRRISSVFSSKKSGNPVNIS